VTRGLRGLGGVKRDRLLGHHAPARSAAGPDGKVAYLLARLDDPEQAGAVAARLKAGPGGDAMEALTAKAFARRTTRYWLVESGAGVAFVFGSVVAILVSVIITSQTLAAAVAGSAEVIRRVARPGVPDVQAAPHRAGPERLGRGGGPCRSGAADRPAGGRRTGRRRAGGVLRRDDGAGRGAW